MTRSKIFGPLVFALLLAAPATASAGSSARGAGDWSTWMRSMWATIGCIIDPGGTCAQGPKPTIGCGIDPDGQCGNSPAPAEIGCTIDPNGHCGNAPAPAEIGCTIDPDGRCRG